MQKRALGTAALAVVLGVAIFLGGCAAPQQATKPTPEEIAARQDSIAKANERQLKINRMFAYDKLKMQDWVKARGYFWKVVDLDVKHQYNDWARLYQTYMETNQPDSARIVLEMGLKHFPDDAFLNATLGFILKAQGQYEQALQHYQTALKSEPENPDYLQKEAEIYESLNQPDEAIDTYQKLLKVKPDAQDAKDRLTSLLRRFRDPAEYIKSLEQDVANQPENVDKRMELVTAYADQAMNEKVIIQADSVIKIDPTLREAYRRKAVALENLNKLPQAIETYKALLQQAPDANDARLRIADSYRLLDEYTKARYWVVKAREAAGGDVPEADYILGQTYESSGDKCSEGRGLEFDDKLVFVVAYGLYKKAEAGSDYTIKDKASKKIAYLDQFIPKYSDWFMNQTKKMPSNKCYDWINPSWPEVSYLKVFLDKLSSSKG